MRYKEIGDHRNPSGRTAILPCGELSRCIANLFVPFQFFEVPRRETPQKPSKRILEVTSSVRLPPTGTDITDI
jgi:hypothetical protein